MRFRKRWDAADVGGDASPHVRKRPDRSRGRGSAEPAILFGWYWTASSTSLYTKMNVVLPSEISILDSVLVYYIQPMDGDVYVRPSVGGREQKVFELGSIDKDDRLFVKPSTTDTGLWDLVARLKTHGNHDPRFVTVVTNLTGEVALDVRLRDANPPRYEGNWFSYGDAQLLGMATNSLWRFSSGFWPSGVLMAVNETSGERVRFCYETPFGAWVVRNAVHLPSDKALFQLGADQICAFDPVTRRVALLWHGRGPVAVMEKRTSEPSPSSAPSHKAF